MNTTATTLSSLPDVPIRHIADYLSGYDLSCWCAASQDWRHRLNQDVLWRWRCDQTTAEHLRRTQCQVEPFFQTPEQENSGLSPICEWRLNFMREVHLWNNWRHDRCKVYSLKNDSVYKFSHPSFCLYKNDFILVCVENQLQLWDIEGLPDQVCVKTLPSDHEISRIALSGDQVVVKQKGLNLVQIFDISITKKEFLFKHSFATSNTRYWALSGSFLVEAENYPCTIKVWNIENQLKVGEEKIENAKFIAREHPCIIEPYLVIQGKYENQYKDCFIVYRLPELVLIFTSGLFEEISDILVINDYIFVNTTLLMDIYCLKTTQHIRQLEISAATNAVKFDNKVCFVDNDNTLKRLTPHSQDIQTLCLDRQNLQIESLNILSTKFFLVLATEVSDYDYNYSEILLKELKCGQARQIANLGFIPDIQYFRVNESKTKLIIITSDGNNLFESWDPNEDDSDDVIKREQFLSVISYW